MDILHSHAASHVRLQHFCSVIIQSTHSLHTFSPGSIRYHHCSWSLLFLPSARNHAHVYAPAETSPGPLQLCPPARTGPRPGPGPSCLHYRWKQTPHCSHPPPHENKRTHRVDAHSDRKRGICVFLCSPVLKAATSAEHHASPPRTQTHADSLLQGHTCPSKRRVSKLHTHKVTHSRAAARQQGMKEKREAPYHFSHWSSIQPSSPSPPESMLSVRRASTAERSAGGGGGGEGPQRVRQ